MFYNNSKLILINQINKILKESTMQKTRLI